MNVMEKEVFICRMVRVRGSSRKKKKIQAGNVNALRRRSDKATYLFHQEM